MFSRIEIGNYFIAEKRENFLLIIIGMMAVVLATVFFFPLKNSFYQGAAISLLLTGIPLSAIKFIHFSRNDLLHIDCIYNLEMFPSVFKTDELPRMKNVIKQYIFSRNLKVILLLAGVFLYCYSRKGFTNSFLSGIGLSLAIMSMITLIADLFALRRGKTYLNHLEKFTASK